MNTIAPTTYFITERWLHPLKIPNKRISIKQTLYLSWNRTEKSTLWPLLLQLHWHICRVFLWSKRKFFCFTAHKANYIFCKFLQRWRYNSWHQEHRTMFFICSIFYCNHIKSRVAWWYFSNQKSQFRYILEGHGTENVGIFYGCLEYLTAIWYISWPFGAFCGHLVYFSRFGMLLTNLATLRKSWFEKEHLFKVTSSLDCRMWIVLNCSRFLRMQRQ
jgi:hypothetical protein